MKNSLFLKILIFSLILSFFIPYYLPINAIGNNEGKWISRTPMPKPRDNIATVTCNNKIYVIGGCDSSGALSRVEVYDPLTDSWSLCTPLPTPKSICGAGVINGKIYVVGAPDDKTYEYDPLTNVWLEKAPIPISISSQIAVAVYNNELYVCGTTNNRPWLYSYNPQINKWSKKADLNLVRSVEGFAVLNGKLYLIGGNEPGHEPSEIWRIDVYDPLKDEWQIGGIADLPEGRTHLGPTIPVINDKIYVIGGWNGFSAQSTVYIYNPLTNSWISGPPMPTARYELAYAVIDNKIYAIGGNYGGYGKHWLSTNEEFNILAFNKNQSSKVNLEEKTIFFDDFESYAIRAKPPPWEFWFNDDGNIVDTTYVSPTRSLRLLGSYGWSTEAIRRFSSTSRYIGYEVYGKVESIKGPWSLTIAFIKRTSPTTGDMIAGVTFFVEDGKPIIKASGVALQSYVANKWYKIKVVYDRDNGIYDVWIDDVFKASVPCPYTNPYAIEGLALCSEWAEINCYFDDVRVFEVIQAQARPKLEATSTVAFIKTIGGKESEGALDIQQTNDGGYILSGVTESFGAGVHDVLIIKLDNKGNIEWSRTIGGEEDDEAFFIQQTNDGGYILAGFTLSFGDGKFDVLVIKLDSKGNIEWSRTIEGEEDDEASSIQQTNDGGYILAGYTESFGAKEADVLVIKLDSKGNIEWSKTIGGEYEDWASSIQQTNDGGYILSGVTESFGAGKFDVLIIKLDKNGNIPNCKFINSIIPSISSLSLTFKEVFPIVATPSLTITSPEIAVTTPSLTLKTICEYSEFVTPIIKKVDISTKVPFNRFFNIKATIFNPTDKTINLNIALNERNGFQAGDVYGDGDEVKSITLAPNKEEVVQFKAKIYGAPRNEDKVIITLYDENGNIIKKIDEKIEVNIECASISLIIAPPWVEINNPFHIEAFISYSFSYPTIVKLDLISNGKLIDEKEGKVSGDGLEFFDFIIENNEIIGNPGIKEFELRLHILYPEEMNIEAKYPYEELTSYSRKINLIISEKTANNPYSNLYPTGLMFRIKYAGKEYIAILMMNASQIEALLKTKDIESRINQYYSTFNWLVFESSPNGLKVVMDNEVYKQISLIAEIAHKRSTIWNSEYVNSLISLYKDISKLATTAEGILVLQKIVLTIIMSIKGKAIESCTIEGIPKIANVAGISLSINEIMEYAKAIGFADKLLSAIEKAEASEDVIIWMSIIGSGDASIRLSNINNLLLNVKPGATIRGEDAIKFYSDFSYANSIGKSSMRLLATRYSDKLLSVKNAIMELVPLSSIPEVYDKLKSLLGVKDVYDYFSFMLNEFKYFKISEEILKEKSLQFRDAYVSDISNKIVINLNEKYGKLYLRIYDIENRHIGIDHKTGLIEVGIPGSYYFDYGNGIMIVMPKEIEIKSMIVDSSKAVMPTEEYNITISVYSKGNIVGSTLIPSKIEKGKTKEYEVKISQDLKPSIEEKAAPAFQFYSLIIVCIVIIVAILIVVFIAKRIIKTK